MAKAEVQQSAKRAGKGAGMLSGAAVAGYFVVLFASLALWWAIGAATGLGWSALIVAVIWAVVGRSWPLSDVRSCVLFGDSLGLLPRCRRFLMP